MKNQVLNNDKIKKICNRLAYQIVENSVINEKILIVGIKQKGLEISKLIIKELKKICSNEVILKSIEINKNDPKSSINCDLNPSDSYEKVFLVDDVLNTGKTLMYSVKKLLDYDFISIKTVVLIDRNHKRFPVKVDFKGISLSTNYDDTVMLSIKKNSLQAIIV
tara:strand:- start:185 stop:676 length:492 start_codon:yes stop_codon:yes gene_type:complete